MKRLQHVIRRSRGRALLLEFKDQRAFAKRETSDRGWWLWPLVLSFALLGAGSGIKQTLEAGRPIGVLPAVLWIMAVTYIAWPLRYSWCRHWGQRASAGRTTRRAKSRR